MLRNPHAFPSLVTCVIIGFSTGCASPNDADPLKTLSGPSLTGSTHVKAMEALDETAPNEPETLKVLHTIVARDTYAVDARTEALNRLAERDLENLKRTIRQSLPRTESWGWIIRCSEIIGERGWIDLSPALVSSWARPIPTMRDDTQRPEYKALAQLHGPENVTEIVYALFTQSKSVGEQGLRTRCWDLLHRLGQRERLVHVIASSEVSDDDAMLLDLKTAAADLGLVPNTREEILWLRKLRMPEHAEFWSRAVAAVQRLSPQRRAELELRDVPILVSASLHDPELLQMTRDELYARAFEYLRNQPHHVQESNYDNIGGNSRQRLHDFKDQLTWGDLAAIHIAIGAVQVPQIVAHLFDYARRDKADESTEYGGVIALDARDRFEILEHQPVMRRHDQEFIASQAMLDAAYTSIFHFHLHVQNFRNDKYAGPSFGDMNYADSTRANCLVFTFINQNTMNVDFYRHGRVVVDLGVIGR
jgi:hypothetical protein